MRRACLVLLALCALSAVFVLPEGKARGAEPAMQLTLTQSDSSSRVGTSVIWTAQVAIENAPDSLLEGWEVEFRSDAGWSSGPVPTDSGGAASFASTGAVAESETVTAVMVTAGCGGVESAPVTHEWWQPTIRLTFREPPPSPSPSPSASPSPPPFERVGSRASPADAPSSPSPVSPVDSSIDLVATVSTPEELPSGTSLTLTEQFYPFYVGGELTRRPAGAPARRTVLKTGLARGTDEVVFPLKHNEHGVALLVVQEEPAGAAVPARAAATRLWEDSVDTFLDISLDVAGKAREGSTTSATATLTSTPHDATSISPEGENVLFQFFASDGTTHKVLKKVPTGSATATAPVPDNLKDAVAVVASITTAADDADPSQTFSVESVSAVSERYVPELTLAPEVQGDLPTGTRAQAAATLAYDGQALEDKTVEFELVSHSADLPEVRRTFRTTARGHAQLSWERSDPVVDEVTVRETTASPESDSTTVYWRGAEPDPLEADGQPFAVTLDQDKASTPVGETAQLTAAVTRLKPINRGERQGRWAARAPETVGVAEVPVAIRGSRGFDADVVTEADGAVTTPYRQQTPGLETLRAEVVISGCDTVPSDPLPHEWPQPQVPSHPVTSASPTSPSPRSPETVTISPQPPSPDPGDSVTPVEPGGGDTSTPTTPPTSRPTSTPTTTPTSTPSPTPTGSVGPDDTAVHPGGPLGVTGAGCSPGQAVTVRLGGVVVGTTTAGPDGTFRLDTVVPDMPLGRYYLSSSCGATSTEPIDVTRTEAMSGQVGAAATAAGGVLAFFVLVGSGLLRRLSG